VVNQPGPIGLLRADPVFCSIELFAPVYANTPGVHGDNVRTMVGLDVSVLEVLTLSYLCSNICVVAFVYPVF
jgi:hypothetical protein